MPSIPISITDVARNFSDCINRVAYRGESFRLLRGKRPVAELHPSPPAQRLADLPDLLLSLPNLPTETLEAMQQRLNSLQQEHPSR